MAAGSAAQVIPAPSGCQTLNDSLSRIWPVATAKVALIAADSGLGGSSPAPSGDLDANCSYIASDTLD